MTVRTIRLLVAAGLSLPQLVAAQDTSALAGVEAAWNDLAYDSVLIKARAALDGGQLTRAEGVRAYELMAFAYMALDSTNRAIDALRQVIYLDPDREYDPERVSPDYIQLHRIALGRELVIRRLSLDSVSFVAGDGTAQVRFETMRPVEYEVRVAGAGFDSIIARGSTSGTTNVPWAALTVDGPVAAGSYDVTVTVSQFADRYQRPLRLLVRHGTVDTLPHLDRIEGLEELPELEVQPRNWIPLALTALAAGVASGAAFALESAPPSGTRLQLFAFDLLALASGTILSLRQPPPRPIPAYIEYNRRVRLMLDRQNREIASANVERRRQVVLTVTPAREPEP